MLSLDGLAIAWVSLARGHGVEAVRAETLQDFVAALASAMRRRGPFPIEVVL
jgi:acetolactate synthase-1/2/3 large subunit